MIVCETSAEEKPLEYRHSYEEDPEAAALRFVEDFELPEGVKRISVRRALHDPDDWTRFVLVPKQATVHEAYTPGEFEAREKVGSPSWSTFKDSGLLWLVNRTLHVFGWAIVLRVDTETGEVYSATPERVTYRGFSRESEERGYTRVTEWMRANGEQLAKEVNDD